MTAESTSFIDNIPFLRQSRRNHAIEHATVHLLSARLGGISFAGRSDAGGFWLYGDAETEAVEDAVRRAMARLDAEPHLAIHPHCGTNLVVGGIIAGVTALAAMGNLRTTDRTEKAWETLPRLMLAGMLAGVASQPLGPWVQKHITTLPRAFDAVLLRVERSQRGRHVVHRVIIADREMATSA